jgi:hypothetical protein
MLLSFFFPFAGGNLKTTFRGSLYGVSMTSKRRIVYARMTGLFGGRVLKLSATERKKF